MNTLKCLKIPSAILLGIPTGYLISRKISPLENFRAKKSDIFVL